MLNYNISQMPMRYLGFPISSRNEGMGAFKNIVAKIGKKLHPWKGKHLSWGGCFNSEKFIFNQHVDVHNEKVYAS